MASRNNLREVLQRGSLVLDGAMGTALLMRGLTGRAPEWNLSRPEEVLAVHRDHVRSGAKLILTNTFVGASDLEAASALRIARDSGAMYVGASLWAGLPDLPDQITQLARADCVWLETATSLEMALEAVKIAVKFTSLPVVITCSAKVALEPLRAAGAVAAGYNCAPWPEKPDGADVLKLDAADLDPAAWAAAMPKARLRGGCCGTTGEYLEALR
ncbi:MAG TPA: homocysteine S-methyltransferase family protein [Myxococcales bacterium]|nr:homocysteine S-methyltransferase family protein [Myxococcales bacterium]